MINQYNPKIHEGLQPIRVLANNIIFHFEKVYPNFREESKRHEKLYLLSPAIQCFLNKEPLNSKTVEMLPYLDEDDKGIKIIHLSETFLSYEWCICYAIVSLYFDFIYYPTLKAREAGITEWKTHDEIEKYVDLSNFQEIKKIISYGFSLINCYSEWDKNNLPNPELFPDEKAENIGRANHAFLCATTYILSHEFSHAKYGHTEKNCKKCELEKENQAEENAFNMIIKGITSGDDNVKFNISIGTIAGICYLFFMNSTLENEAHPDCDVRVKKYFELLEIDEKDSLWAIPCIAYQLWNIAYGKELRFPEHEKTYKDLFLSLQEQEWEKR